MDIYENIYQNEIIETLQSKHYLKTYIPIYRIQIEAIFNETDTDDPFIRCLKGLKGLGINDTNELALLMGVEKKVIDEFLLGKLEKSVSEEKSENRNYISWMVYSSAWINEFFPWEWHITNLKYQKSCKFKEFELQMNIEDLDIKVINDNVTECFNRFIKRKVNDNILLFNELQEKIKEIPTEPDLIKKIDNKNIDLVWLELFIIPEYDYKTSQISWITVEPNTGYIFSDRYTNNFLIKNEDSVKQIEKEIEKEYNNPILNNTDHKIYKNLPGLEKCSKDIKKDFINIELDILPFIKNPDEKNIQKKYKMENAIRNYAKILEVYSSSIIINDWNLVGILYKKIDKIDKQIYLDENYNNNFNLKKNWNIIIKFSDVYSKIKQKKKKIYSKNRFDLALLIYILYDELIKKINKKFTKENVIHYILEINLIRNDYIHPEDNYDYEIDFVKVRKYMKNLMPFLQENLFLDVFKDIIERNNSEESENSNERS